MNENKSSARGSAARRRTAGSRPRRVPRTARLAAAPPGTTRWSRRIPGRGPLSTAPWHPGGDGGSPRTTSTPRSPAASCAPGHAASRPATSTRSRTWPRPSANSRTRCGRPSPDCAARGTAGPRSPPGSAWPGRQRSSGGAATAGTYSLRPPAPRPAASLTAVMVRRRGVRATGRKAGPAILVSAARCALPPHRRRPPL